MVYTAAKPFRHWQHIEQTEINKPAAGKIRGAILPAAATNRSCLTCRRPASSLLERRPDIRAGNKNLIAANARIGWRRLPIFRKSA